MLIAIVKNVMNLSLVIGTKIDNIYKFDKLPTNMKDVMAPRNDSIYYEK